MHIPLPKITVTGRIGICLLTFAVGKLDPQLLSSPVLLYGLSVLGVMLILWEAAAYAAQLAQHIRSRSDQGPSTFPRPSQQPFGVRKDGAR
jgi:hypothetical protein